MAGTTPPAAGGSSGSAAASSGGGNSGTAKVPKWFEGLEIINGIFGHKLGNALTDMVGGWLTGRSEKAKTQAIRLPNFGHIMTILQAQHPLVFAQICDLMQFLASDDDRADFQYHVAGIGGDQDPKPSVEFLVQLAGMAKSTGLPGLQEMKDYLTQLGYIGPRSEDPLEKVQRYAKVGLNMAKDLPGDALDAAKTQLTAAVDGIDAAVAASQIPAASASLKASGSTAWQRAKDRWR